MKLASTQPLPRGRAASAPQTSRRAFGSLLTNRQKQVLAMEAAKAFAKLEKYGSLDLPAEIERSAKSVRQSVWRHQQTLLITQRVESFTLLKQSEYRPMLEHFQTLSGDLGPAFDTALREIKDAACHRAPGCEWVRDLHHWATRAGLGEPYIRTISMAKFKTSRMEELSERQLKQLHDTIVNRARDKLDLGEKSERNKSQRKSRKAAAQAQAAEPAEMDQPF